MQVVYRDYPIFNSNGSPAGVLDGTYEASPNSEQQPGWYALRQVRTDGSIDPRIVANIHIVGVTTT